MLHALGARACSYFTIGNLVQNYHFWYGLVLLLQLSNPQFLTQFFFSCCSFLKKIILRNNPKQVATTLFLFGSSSPCIFREMLLLSSLSWVFYWSFLFCFVSYSQQQQQQQHLSVLNIERVRELSNLHMRTTMMRLRLFYDIGWFLSSTWLLWLLFWFLVLVTAERCA